MDTIALELTAMAHGGAALGRHEGKVIFVPYALPGETVRAEIIEDKERYAHARLLEVLEHSPDRVEPPCPYFGPEGCGGCQWQHASYEAQLLFKAQVVADQLVRIGRIEEPTVLPTLPDAVAWEYRNHARFRPAAETGMGFLSAGSHQVVPIERCLVLHPLLSDLYDSLDLEVPGLQALTIRAGTVTGDKMLVFEMEDDLPPSLATDMPVSCVLLLSDGVHVNLVGRNHITEVVAGHMYRVSAPSFFQANVPQAGQLVHLVLDYLDLGGDETVLDGYCGVGLFTLPLAEQACLILAVETSPPAVEDLLQNTAAVDNIEVIEGDMGGVVSNLSEAPDAVVVDPPRTGLEREAVEGLVAASPARIVYVSCDPATLARDGRQLARAGYSLVKAQPVDMFPQTSHIEVVSLWARE